MNWAQVAEQHESELEQLQQRYDDLVLEKERVDTELKEAKRQTEEMEQLLMKSKLDGDDGYAKRITELEELVRQFEEENREMRRHGGEGKTSSEGPKADQTPLEEQVIVLEQEVSKWKQKVETMEVDHRVCMGVEHVSTRFREVRRGKEEDDRSSGIEPKDGDIGAIT